MKTILVDTDGVLTSGKVMYSESGERCKEFHSRDITAIKRLKELGHNVIILSQSTWGGVKYFAGRCGVEWFSGVKDKLAFVKDNGIEDYIAISDDIGDYDFLDNAAISFIPNDGAVMSCCTYRLITCGGDGVMSEIFDYLTNNSKNEE